MSQVPSKNVLYRCIIVSRLSDKVESVGKRSKCYATEKKCNYRHLLRPDTVDRWARKQFQKVIAAGQAEPVARGLTMSRVECPLSARSKV
jgi:hypothetical protein